MRYSLNNVSRGELERQIAALVKATGATWEPVGSHGPHDKFRLNGRSIMIPRHREIGEGLARAILRQIQRALEQQQEGK